MKKLLNGLLIILLTGSPMITVISCKTKNNNDNGDVNNNLTPLQNEMIEGASFISKLIVAGRHENLNYNINEILSLFLTPEPESLKLPVTYNYEGQNVNLTEDLNKYKNYLAPNIDKINNGTNATMAASYIMGMYDNDFYSKIINGDVSDEKPAYYFNDTFSEDGNQGFNKKSNNAMGFAAGLGKNIDLSEEENRRNLAWGIQDTGALSNYLLSKGFDGANPGDTNGKSNEVSKPSDSTGGSNGSGYLYYNSLLLNGSAKKSAIYPNKKVSDKIADLDFGSYNDLQEKNENIRNSFSSALNASKPNEMKLFNSTGNILVKEAGDNKAKGYISLFASMFDNFSETFNGASMLTEFSNILTPYIYSKESGLDVNQIAQAVGFSFITNLWQGLKNISSDSLNKNVITDEILKSINSLDPALEPLTDLFGFIIPNVKDLGIDKLFSKQDQDVKLPGTNAKNIYQIIDKIYANFEKLSENDKESFINSMFVDDKSPFKSAYSKLIEYMSDDVWNESVKSNNIGGMNLLKLGSEVYRMAADKDYQDLIKQIQVDYKDYTKISELSSSSKTELMSQLGYKNSAYEENSPLYKLYNGVTNDSVLGEKEFRIMVEGFRDYLSRDMEVVHGGVIQYLTDKKYWSIDDISMDTNNNTQTKGKMSFTINYKGNGDVTSNASMQKTKLNVPNKFNPYQTILNYQDDEISKLKGQNLLDEEKIKLSGKVLGIDELKMNDEQIINYDGYGNFKDYKTVNNKYKITWENISENSESPYWIITGINCYNENGDEFYNIY
ncbi:hypothetical protein [Spiroplasma turonicum]|uniref:Lipoprotein n=1 Tax=Spiroplasma turonicum TaxID=216946 RepID=A0A0K1P6W5_9MOLU|nr:hypothetical protein [Spiroplasma turonicum]AKU79959.1 hypothetical protein STURON_00713 [Spiroplasma turonicum]ALX70972.1 hypothetical protein STURO_v1c07130 [Spiroplasma turonicum]